MSYLNLNMYRESARQSTSTSRRDSANDSPVPVLWDSPVPVFFLEDRIPSVLGELND